ncbi:MAG: recombination protein O N-terminal domain-containing protein [Patescibacteria group bacterium]
MSVYYGTDARLISARDWGEADRLMTFFTRDLGRVDAVAKSVRLAKSKLSGHLNLFSRARIMVTPGREYWRLLDAEQSSESKVSSDALFFAQNIAQFLVSITVRDELAYGFWEIVSSLDTIRTTEALNRAKINSLRIVGMLPEKDDLKIFFSPKAIVFIESRAHGECFADLVEVDAFDAGIRQILATNHMV